MQGLLIKVINKCCTEFGGIGGKFGARKFATNPRITESLHGVAQVNDGLQFQVNNGLPSL
jgi:hypothetical protein